MIKTPFKIGDVECIKFDLRNHIIYANVHLKNVSSCPDDREANEELAREKVNWALTYMIHEGILEERQDWSSQISIIIHK